jgi:hypothetical protein
MTQMVRKQIYIEKRQKARLKQAAKTSGLSEAEIVRQAIDQHLTAGGKGLPHDPAVWEMAVALVQSLQAQGPLRQQGPRWTRDELYEERENRYGQHPR